MKHFFTALIFLIFAIGTAGVQGGPNLFIDNLPPSVVKTFPQSGTRNVDPSLKEVRVVFSKDMMTEQMWSWCYQTPETFPEIDKNRIHYLKDKRTCVLPVKLKPGKTYVIWINTEKFKNFRDIQNNPAVPYLLVFETRK